MGFCIEVGTNLLFKFGKKNTSSKLGEANPPPPLIVSELKEQQHYETTLILPTLLTANVQHRNGKKSTSSYLCTIIRDALTPGIPNMSQAMGFFDTGITQESDRCLPHTLQYSY